LVAQMKSSENRKTGKTFEELKTLRTRLFMERSEHFERSEQLWVARSSHSSLAMRLRSVEGS